MGTVSTIFIIVITVIITLALNFFLVYLPIARIEGEVDATVRALNSTVSKVDDVADAVNDVVVEVNAVGDEIKAIIGGVKAGIEIIVQTVEDTLKTFCEDSTFREFFPGVCCAVGVGTNCNNDGGGSGSGTIPASGGQNTLFRRPLFAL